MNRGVSEENENAQTSKGYQRAKSTPGSLDCESDMLPLSYRDLIRNSLQTYITYLVYDCQLLLKSIDELGGNCKRAFMNFHGQKTEELIFINDVLLFVGLT